MNNSDGLLGMIALLLKAASWIGSGMLAWNWIEPEGFFGFAFFLFLWGAIGKVFDFALLLFVANLTEK